jgi:VanZ family protein
VTAFLACVAVALLDEGLQALNPARSGKISDVAEDASGAAIALLVATPCWDRLRQTRLLARIRSRR